MGNLVNTLRPLVHIPTIEYLDGLKVNTLGGSSFVGDHSDMLPDKDNAFFVAGASAIYNYNSKRGNSLLLPPSAIVGTFGAGACAAFNQLSMLGGVDRQTATAGTTTTITTNQTIVKNLKGTELRVVAGTGIGYQGTIKSNTLGANSVITLVTANGAAFDATTVFQIFAGSLWVFIGGTTNGLGVYDKATNVWTQKTTVGIAASWATDGQLIVTNGRASNSGIVFETGTISAVAGLVLTTNLNLTALSRRYFRLVITSGTGAGQSALITSHTTGASSTITTESFVITPDTTSKFQIEGNGFDNGTATAGSTTTLTTSKTLVLNQFANSQIRIISGTGQGQIKAIASNTAGASGVITFASAMTTAPDATSVYVIEGNDDAMYLAGNNATPFWKYSITGGTWSALTARPIAQGSGATLNWIDSVKDSDWNDGTYPILTSTLVKQNGRYIYSFTGGAANTLYVYDIALNTWTLLAYGNQTDTFTAGSCSVDINGQIYLMKEATQYLYKFNIARNTLDPFVYVPIVQSTLVAGSKLVIQNYKEGANSLYWLYVLHHSKPDVSRYLLLD